MWVKSDPTGSSAMVREWRWHYIKQFLRTFPIVQTIKTQRELTSLRRFKGSRSSVSIGSLTIRTAQRCMESSGRSWCCGVPDQRSEFCEATRNCLRDVNLRGHCSAAVSRYTTLITVTSTLKTLSN
ncbi:uncharacterized protein LOC133319262 [Danaus plexippus]|uniref:uncharacterized protein LOC133319262 n=1 Tax=Danaus plexippus TaxID=13037 RepID=UPI002AB2C3B9|nr:uncharacterized protein LOC133319262 [Danaus plexippus]